MTARACAVRECARLCMCACACTVSCVRVCVPVCERVWLAGLVQIPREMSTKISDGEVRDTIQQTTDRQPDRQSLDDRQATDRQPTGSRQATGRQPAGNRQTTDRQPAGNIHQAPGTIHRTQQAPSQQSTVRRCAPGQRTVQLRQVNADYLDYILALSKKLSLGARARALAHTLARTRARAVVAGEAPVVSGSAAFKDVRPELEHLRQIRAGIIVNKGTESPHVVLGGESHISGMFLAK